MDLKHEALLIDALCRQEELEMCIDGPLWRLAEHRYENCILVECAETMDAFGYKHWKRQHTDWQKVRWELVDIFHFALAKSLQQYPRKLDKEELRALANRINARMADSDSASYDFLDNIQAIAENATGPFLWGYFIQAWRLSMEDYMGEPLEELCRYYTAKNALNAYRQDNGDRRGTYDRSWPGDHPTDESLLTELVEDGEFANGQGRMHSFQDFYDALQEAYKARKSLAS